MDWRKFSNVMLVTLGMVLMFGLSSAFAETSPNVYVDDGWTQGTCPPGYTWHWDAFNNIQEGIDSVVTGGTVHVFDGAYTENILINKSLTLAREGAGTVTVNSADNTCFDTTANTGVMVIGVSANDVSIADITVDGSLSATCGPGYRAMAKRGIYGSSIDGFTVSGCEVMNCVNAIVYVLATNGDFQGNTVHGYGVHLNMGGGIYLWGSTGTITGNTVYDGDAIGITFHQGASGTAKGNSVDDCGLGILNNGNNATTYIDSNTVTNCDAGIQSWANNATSYVRHNVITGCTDGVEIYREGGAYYNYIIGNTIDGTTSPKGRRFTYSSGELALVPHSAGTKAGGSGVWISTSGGIWGTDDVHAYLKNNSIKGNDYGVYLHDTTTSGSDRTMYVTIGGSAVYSNYICGNSIQECYVEGADDNNVNATYNWWDYNGVDPEPVIYHDGDGGGGLLTVYYNPWLKSKLAVIPAAVSIAVSETVTVDIVYDDQGYPQHPALKGVKMDINYDTNFLEYVSYSEGDGEWGWLHVVDTIPGVISIDGFYDPAFTDSGVIFDIIFHGTHPDCQVPDSSDITLTNTDLRDPANSPIGHNVNDGWIRVLDPVAPTCWIDPDGEGEWYSWVRPPVIDSVHFHDDVALDDSWYDDCNWAWTKWDNNVACTDAGHPNFAVDLSGLGQGSHTIHFRCRDDYGNFSDTCSWQFYKDSAVPVVTSITLKDQTSGSQTCTDDPVVEVVLVASDAHSGLDSVRFELSQGTGGLGAGPWLAFATPTTVDLTDLTYHGNGLDGDYWLSFEVMDSVGNVSGMSGWSNSGVAIHLDTAAPTAKGFLVHDRTSPYSHEYTDDTSVRVRFSGVFDTAGVSAGCGLGTLLISESSTFATGVDTHAITVPPHDKYYYFDLEAVEGLHWVYGKVIDVAENFTIYSDSIELDTTAAITTVFTLSDTSGNSHPDYTDERTVRAYIKAYDPVKVLKQYTLRGKDSYTVGPVPFTGEADTTVLLEWWWEGTHTVWCVIEDKAGNIDSTSASIIYDKTPPPAPPAGFSGTPSASVLLNWTWSSDAWKMSIRRSIWNDYPTYDPLLDPGYPPTLNVGFIVGDVFNGDPLPYHDTSTPVRAIYNYSIFYCDSAGNYCATPANARATNYFLGDVDPPDGDNDVDPHDIFVLSNTYGTSPPADSTCDVGPTDDGSGLGIPLPDGTVDFEDLMIFAQNYKKVPPAAKTVPTEAPVGEVAVGLEAPTEALSLGDEFEVKVNVGNAVDVMGMHIALNFDQRKLALVGVEEGALLSGYNAFFKSTGTANVDFSAAVLGASLNGSGEIATIRFKVLRGGQIELASEVLDLRNSNNDKLEATFKSVAIGAVPQVFALSQNYPNPFNPNTEIGYQIAMDTYVSLRVYNVAGQLTRTLVDKAQETGYYTARWDGKNEMGIDAASGVYFYRIVAGDYTSTRKMVLMK